jgi:glycosyltransferase involved in cell wall biosynthesis
MKRTAPGDPSSARSVLIIVENLSVPFDRRVWRECRALREAGYKVSVICPRGIGTDTKPRERIEGIAIYRYPVPYSSGSFASYVLEYSVALVMSFWLMLIVLVREGYHVIQICNPPDLLILAALPFKPFGKKVIFDQHDLSPEIYQTQKRKEGRRDPVVRMLLHLERLTYFFSDAVMVVNESCRRIALKRGSKSDREVFVVRNGPSVHDLKSASPNPGLKRGKRYLLCFVGMMGPQDGIDVLLRTVRTLVEVHQRHDFHVLIMGGGSVLEEMNRYAAELAVSEFVTFTGQVSHQQVLEGIATADVCLCPDPKTPLSDKCSLVKTIEYMSLGRAFVAFELEEVSLSAAGAAAYARANDEADFAKKIDGLLENEELRVRMGILGRDRVMQGLTWEHSKESLLRAYDAVFQKRYADAS